ncbi:MAG: hypothetical protein H6696_19955 [Deferribacteres bacterium]|nr:hypothetical protein [candidate division KSB1 bacterium]MCB9504205.1 hypothetical protein [Deferribacteres bacterium]
MSLFEQVLKVGLQGDFWKNGASHSKVQTVKNHAACKGQALEEEFYQKMHLTAKHTSNTKIIRVSHAFRGSSFMTYFNFKPTARVSS